jgi:hypothetical protein
LSNAKPIDWLAAFHVMGFAALNPSYALLISELSPQFHHRNSGIRIPLALQMNRFHPAYFPVLLMLLNVFQERH